MSAFGSMYVGVCCCGVDFEVSSVVVRVWWVLAFMFNYIYIYIRICMYLDMYRLMYVLAAEVK